MSIFTSARNRLARMIATRTSNLFNDAFLKTVGGGFTPYDPNNETYLNEGYGSNPDVYAVIQQMASKTVSIPYEVKKVIDKKEKSKLDVLRKSTSQVYTPQQYLKSKLLSKNSFEEKAFDFPLEKPNEIQTWSEIWALYKTFLRTTGNFYFYMMNPKEGSNKGVPNQCYVLPSHLMQIVVKDKVDLMGVESPIKEYILTNGDSFTAFPADDVIHIKLSNPFYDSEGSHLYGLAPLRASLMNIQSSNEAIKNNAKVLQNGGAFGFIHSKNSALSKEQADEIKSRLVEMDANPDRLSKIAGVSAELGFTRISLTTDELKPFDYLKFDQKSICNVLGWSDKLLNNDNSSQYGGTILEFRKQVVTDNIMPDLQLLQSALNDHFLPRFKGYEGTVIEWNYEDLPEMQSNMKDLSVWLNNALDRGVINRDEYRASIRYPKKETLEMQVHTVGLGVQTLDDAIIGIEPIKENDSKLYNIDSEIKEKAS